MIARLPAVLALALGLLLVRLPEPLAVPGGAVVASAQAVPQASPEEAAPAPAATGLPQRAPDPRTLHEFWPVFLAFSVSWAGIVAYLLTVGGAYGRTARTVQQLGEGRSAPGGGA